MQRPIPLKRDQDLSAQTLLHRWQETLENLDRAAGTRKKYLQALTLFLNWYEQEEREVLQISHLTPIAIIGYRNELQHEQHLSLSTINLRLNAIKSWSRWLYEQEYVPNDPGARVKLLAGNAGSSREGLTNPQVNALLRQAQQSRHPERDYAIVQLLLQTGIRLSECSALCFGDIHLGERGGTLNVRAGKGNKHRSVPLNSTARFALTLSVGPRLGIEKPTVKNVAANWPRPKTPAAAAPLFESQKGGKLTTSAMGQMIAELVEAAGDLVPPETSAHQLRHTFGRNYLNQYPGDVVGLASLLGHSSLDTTRLYSQPIVSQLAGRVEKLNINAYGE